MIRRLLLFPVTLVGISLTTFLLVHLAPGDPASVQAGMARGVSPQSVAELRRTFDLDRPLPEQAWRWFGRSTRLDFGRSLVDGRPVREKIFQALPITALLAALGCVLIMLVAVPLGCGLALWRSGPALRWGESVLAILFSLPTAAVAMLLLFAGVAYGPHRASVMLAAAACLALPVAIKFAYYQRSALREVLSREYILTARAKGLGEGRVVIRHALRNALMPMVTLIGAEFSILFSAAVVVEQVFGLPGIGLLGVDAVLQRDYPMLLGLSTFTATLTLITVLLVDGIYRVIDPRVRGVR